MFSLPLFISDICVWFCEGHLSNIHSVCQYLPKVVQVGEDIVENIVTIYYNWDDWDSRPSYLTALGYFGPSMIEARMIHGYKAQIQVYPEHTLIRSCGYSMIFFVPKSIIKIFDFHTPQ